MKRADASLQAQSFRPHVLVRGSFDHQSGFTPIVLITQELQRLQQPAAFARIDPRGLVQMGAMLGALHFQLFVTSLQVRNGFQQAIPLAR